MYAKISVIVICIEAIMCFLLHNLHDFAFKEKRKPWSNNYECELFLIVI